MLRIKSAHRGFTMIELLVVISIIGIFGTMVAVVSIGGNLKKARDNRRKSDLESIRSALEVYRNENKYYPIDINSLVPNYITALPLDPSTATSYSYGYREADNTTCDNSSSTEYCTKYELCTNLENTSDADINNGASACWQGGLSGGSYNLKKTQL